MDTVKERIEKEALDAADSFDIRGCAAHQGYLRGYIAAAQETAALREENERLKEAMKDIVSIAERTAITVDNPHWREQWEHKRKAIEKAKKLLTK